MEYYINDLTQLTKLIGKLRNNDFSIKNDFELNETGKVIIDGTSDGSYDDDDDDDDSLFRFYLDNDFDLEISNNWVYRESTIIGKIFYKKFFIFSFKIESKITHYVNTQNNKTSNQPTIILNIEKYSEKLGQEKAIDKKLKDIFDYNLILLSDFLDKKDERLLDITLNAFEIANKAKNIKKFKI